MSLKVCRCWPLAMAVGESVTFRVALPSLTSSVNLGLSSSAVEEKYFWNCWICAHVLWSLKSLLTFQYYTELNENDSFNKQLMCWHKMISFSLSLLNDHINNLLMLTLLSGPVDRTTPDDRVSHCGPLRTLSSHWRTLQVVQNKKTGVFVCLFTFQIL